MSLHPWTVLETFESDSRRGQFYEIRRGSDGKVYCTCKGWAFAADHICKHLRRRRLSGIVEPIADPKDVSPRKVAGVTQSAPSDSLVVSPKRNINIR